VDKVLLAFGQAGMTLKLSKCKFAHPKVKLVGLEVGSGTKTVLQGKVEAMRDIPEPHTKKLLRSFLGMCGFYRCYILGFSEIALPLTDLTKSKQSHHLKFNEKEQVSFLSLKDKLCESTTPRLDHTFIIRTNASDYAVGASLSQTDEVGVDRPIAFASAKL